MDSVDNTIDLETPQTLAPQPKLALSLPTELWDDIINLLDIDSLYSVRQTCVALFTLVRPRLIEKLALNPPLGDLYTLTKEQNPDLPFYECAFRMHYYINSLLKEPKKWADKPSEWDGYDPTRCAETNLDHFCKHRSCKGRPMTREWTDWNSRVFEPRCLLRRQLARLWAADRRAPLLAPSPARSPLNRFFPFPHEEGETWMLRY